jgi:hypothetical protein
VTVLVTPPCGTEPWGSVRGRTDSAHTLRTAAVGACCYTVQAEALRGADAARKESYQYRARSSLFPVESPSFMGYKDLSPSVPQNSVSDATYHVCFQVKNTPFLSMHANILTS